MFRGYSQGVDCGAINVDEPMATAIHDTSAEPKADRLRATPH